MTYLVRILVAALASSDAEIERLRAQLTGTDGWEANAQYLLARCPHTVRHRPGGGAETRSTPQKGVRDGAA